MNDAFTFKSDQASSLWDSRYQCKLAFYAVTDVGKYYNALTGLISKTGDYKEKDCPSQEWSEFTVALKAAKAVITHNYSSGESAAEALRNTFITLQSTINNLFSR